LSEIGAGSGSSYPGGLDANASVEVNAPNPGKTKARKEVVEDLSACIINIETTLGVDPQGSKATVVARLDQEHNADGSHKDTLVVTVSGHNQSISGRKIFASGISLGVDGLFGTATGHIAGKTVVGASGAMWIQDDVRISGSLFINGNDNPILKNKVIDIGDWNMDITNGMTVVHGLASANIRSISVLIRNDAGTTYIPLDYGDNAGSNTPQGYFYAYSVSEAIVLYRLIGGLFDYTTYISTSYNRGWITIWYI